MIGWTAGAATPKPLPRGSAKASLHEMNQMIEQLNHSNGGGDDVAATGVIGDGSDLR
jgi:hypothetical protein